VSFQLLSPTCREFIAHGAVGGEPGATREYIPARYPSSSLKSLPLAMERPPSQGSILVDTSLPGPSFSKLSEVSEAKGHITKLPGTRPDAVPDILISPALGHVRELEHRLHRSYTLVTHHCSPLPSYPGPHFSILRAGLGGHPPATSIP